MKTLISQYEEISCDAGPLLWRIQDNVAFERVDGRDVLDTIEGYLNALERSGRAGILQQRVARPNVLGSEGDPARQTVTWSQLSVRHVAAFAAAFPPLGTPECMTSVAVRSDNPVADWKSAVVRAAQANQDNPVAAAELAAGSLVDFPYSAFLRWEYAIAMDSQDEVQSALELLIEALILQPDNDGIWSSLSVVLDRDGRPRDSAVARIVAEHFVTTSGNG
jgi:hypothetical protein